MITHNEALTKECDRILRMKDGRLEEDALEEGVLQEKGRGPEKDTLQGNECGSEEDALQEKEHDSEGREHA